MATYQNESAKLLRSVTETAPHVWCEDYGWHDVNECGGCEDEENAPHSRECQLTRG